MNQYGNNISGGNSRILSEDTNVETELHNTLQSLDPDELKQLFHLEIAEYIEGDHYETKYIWNPVDMHILIAVSFKYLNTKAASAVKLVIKPNEG